MVDSSSEISSAHLDPVVSAVEELGKAILPNPGSVRIYWGHAEVNTKHGAGGSAHGD